MTRKHFALSLLLTLLPMQMFAAGDLWFHLRTTERGNEKNRVTVNLPYAVIEQFGPIASSDERSHQIIINDHKITLSELRAAWNSVRTAPDSTLATIVRDGERITVQKSAQNLLIRSEGNERSEVRISGALVVALLSGKGEELNIGAALKAMATTGDSELLSFHDDDSTVRMWVDRDPEGEGRK